MIKSPSRSSGGGGGAVDSVNGKTGVVVLNAADVGARPAAAPTVSSVNGVSGAVTLAPVPQSPDTYPPVPAPANDEFDSVNFNEPVLDTVGDRFAGALPWAWINQGGAAAAISKGSLILSVPATLAFELRGVVQAAPVGPWIYRASVRGLNAQPLDYSTVGVFVMNAADEILTGQFGRGATYYNCGVQQCTDPQTPTVYTAAGPNIIIDLGSIAPTISYPMYLEVENDGTSLIFRASTSGNDGVFSVLNTIDLAGTIGAIDRIGLFLESRNDNPASAAFDWFRVM